MKDKIKKDARFLAQWNHDEFWYPATVLDKDKECETGIYVRFDDGDKQWCAEEQLLPIDIEVGDRVHARWNGEDEYFLARVTKVKDDKYALAYDDESEEWTTLSMMRVTR